MKRYKSQINKVYLVRDKQYTIDKVKITSSRDSIEYARRLWTDDMDILESCYVLFLNQSNNTLGYELLSKGGITGTVIDIRLVAKMALDLLATSVIILHNHPSGGLNPSFSDKDVSSKIQKGLKLLEIKVLDFLIITEDNYYSFADKGILN